MNFGNVLNVVASVAPTIASAIGTPVAGAAVAALEAVFGITPKPSDGLDSRQNDVAAAIAGATPEQLAAMRKADQDYAARMAEAGFKDKEAIAALQLQETQTYVQDTSDARKANAANDRVFWLGVVILGTFAAIMSAALWGAYALLTGKLPIVDAAVVGMVAGFVGTIIGYVSANAQQVVSFYYGSSKGSESKSDAMSAAFKSAFSTPQNPPQQ